MLQVSVNIPSQAAFVVGLAIAIYVLAFSVRAVLPLLSDRAAARMAKVSKAKSDRRSRRSK